MLTFLLVGMSLQPEQGCLRASKELEMSIAQLCSVLSKRSELVVVIIATLRLTLTSLPLPLSQLVKTGLPYPGLRVRCTTHSGPIIVFLELS